MYHCHTDYSLLDSTSSFKEYVDLAVSNNQKAIAFTEHGKPMGWISKKMYCDSVGIKYIHGVEIYLTEQLNSEEGKIRDNYHTILLAKNYDGVKELNALVSKSCDEEHFYYTNRISFEEFLSISDNIISTSACLASPLNRLPENHPMYMSLAKKYTFLEIQGHNNPEQIAFNKKLYNLSKKLSKPLIAGTDTHSSSDYKAECRSVLLSAKNKSYGDEDSFDLTYKTYDELVNMFEIQAALPDTVYLEAIENTNLLYDLVEDFTLDTSIKYPILYGSKEEDALKFEDLIYSKFEEKLQKGIIAKEQKEAFEKAISEELSVFKALGMEGFMLSMSELITWCKNQNMAIGTARGSVGGSRIAYITDIIDLNPETWQTVFSRFCNADRQEIGDIDIDCVESDRPKIFEYIVERFGSDKTARVASFGTLKDKAAIDEIGRCLSKLWVTNNPHADAKNNPYSLSNIKIIKSEYDVAPEKTINKYPDLFYYLPGLIDVKVSQSVHPAGMVISPITLNDAIGTFSKDGDTCLMADMEEIHDGTGLAKYDFLILKTVQVIRDTVQSCGKRYPLTHEVDWDDVNVWEDMLVSPIGIFQMESKFAFECLKKFKPKNIFEMSLVTACIRPSGASYRDELLARHKHKNPSEIIDNLLRDNLGYLIYQEDTIKFLQQICGLSGSEADNIRRAIGRKQKDRLDRALPEILEGYCNKSNKDREKAEREAKEFLQVIEDSADYQFGYNHSIAYCLLGYLCAYYRYYYPIEFITSFLNNAANEEDIKNGTALAKFKGISIVSPKFGISKGNYFFNKEDKVIAKGIASIKYMGEAVANQLYLLSKSKEYTSFMELLCDMKEYTSIDARQIDILIKLDFFSKFGNQRELLRIVGLFDIFKQGTAKQIKKSLINGTELGEIVKKYSVGTTKTGKEAKSYTIIEPLSILKEAEQMVLNSNTEDLELSVKVRNFEEFMGYAGYISGNEYDRNKLFVRDVYPVKRKKDNVIFGYSVLTQSIGSGKESRMTVFKRIYEKDPIHKGDIIVCKKWERDGIYFRMTQYEHLF